MKDYVVKVGFMGDKQDAVLYHKTYKICEESAKKAVIFVANSLTMLEFHNFIVEDVKEMGNEH